MAGPLEWSAQMDRIFGEHIDNVVCADPRTDWAENVSLGYPFEVIRRQVLAKGLADFRNGHEHAVYGDLSPDEKVLLYCFTNFKKHFFTAMATFQAHLACLRKLFASGEKTFVFDIGCGPGTACLALAEVLRGRKFSYVGIELAPAMRKMAGILWRAALKEGMIGDGSKAGFPKSSWAQLPIQRMPRDSSVLLVFSYFFASRFLTKGAVHSLAEFVAELRDSDRVKALVLAHLNSPAVTANESYYHFKRCLGLSAVSSLLERTIEYRKKRGSTRTGTERFVCDIVRLKGT